jgi:hypothetical protein
MYPDYQILTFINNSDNELTTINFDIYSGFYHIIISGDDNIGAYFIVCKKSRIETGSISRLHCSGVNIICKWLPHERIKILTDDNSNHNVTVKIFKYL